MRPLRRVLLASAALLVLGFATLGILAWAYQDEVEAKLIAELNAHLKVPVEQNGIDLTLIERFPRASLRFSDVLIRETRTDSIAADTLLSARSLYIEFGLLSLLRGDYTVSELHGEQVKLYPGFDRNGNGNWLIWRADTNAQGGADLKLKKVTFNHLATRFRDDRSALEVNGTSDRLTLKGRFRNTGSALTIDGDLALDRWTTGRETLLADRQADVRLKLGFGGADDAFRIEKGSEVLPYGPGGEPGDVPVAVALAVVPGPKGRTIDLRANGFNMDLAQVAALLPENLHRHVKRYDLRGEADIAVHYAGPLAGDGPSLSVGMTLHDGRLKETVTGALFSEVHGELALELTPAGTLRKLLVKGLKAKTGNGSIGGSIDLSGAANAKLKATVHGDLALADLLGFAGTEALEDVRGRLVADARITGTLRDPGRVTAADLHGLAVQGKADLSNASLKLKGTHHLLTELNAAIALNGTDARVSGLRCQVQGNTVALDGTLRNFTPWLLSDRERLTVEARGSSPRLDLASLVSASPQGQRPSDNSYTITFPANIDLDLQAGIDELVFEDFSAQRITGSVTLEDRVLHVSSLAFRTADGQVSGNLRVDGRGTGSYPLSLTAEVERIDMRKLFAEFRNFGQGFITEAHLNGLSDLRVSLTASLSPSFTLDQNSLRAVASVVVDHGELKNHPAMIAVADHLRQNKLVSPFVNTDELRKRLAHITFDRLENQIEIRDRTVHVPQMIVRSSLMDLEMSGSQTFDGGVDDHLNFRLSDLFRTGSSSDESGPVVDDGTGMRLFLHMYGTTDDLRFSNDGAAAAARRKEKMKQESAELKGLLSDILHGRGGLAPEPTTKAIITVEGTDPAKEGASPGMATAPAPRKKGLGRLLEKDEEVETIILE
ncbi:MAG TPA: AsmA-like C-terminal region-containing protein [Flavobacteriales bacterium]|nr:AsmA-like C-terminal region-containing protein [Flavobacteriales bacterium]